MSARNDGGPAFPHGNQELGDAHRIAQPGMTLRDWFAGQALAAMGTWIPAYDGYRLGAPLDNDEIRNARAKYAYAQADAMLAARETQP